MVKLRYDCDCKTCPGSSAAQDSPRAGGEIVYGGWKCMCACHLRWANRQLKVKMPPISTEPCPHCDGTGIKSERKRKGGVAEQVAGFEAFIRGEPVEYRHERSKGRWRWLRLRGNDVIHRKDIIRPARKGRAKK